MNLLASEARSGPLPTITTERLVLRPFEPDDLDRLAVLTSDPETMRYIGGTAWTRDTTAEMIERHRVQYPRGLGFGAVIERATGEFVGWNGLQNPRRWMSLVMECHLPDDTIEVGWALRPQCLGRGYATEAARAWLEYGFTTLALPEIIAVHDPPNAASERVMDRLGMTRRETLELTDGDTLCLHVLTRQTWAAQR